MNRLYASFLATVMIFGAAFPASTAEGGALAQLRGAVPNANISVPETPAAAARVQDRWMSATVSIREGTMRTLAPPPANAVWHDPSQKRPDMKPLPFVRMKASCPIMSLFLTVRFGIG